MSHAPQPSLHSPPEPSERSGPENPIRAAIAEAIEENPVLLFMKGTTEQPACGFSARTVAALQALQTSFATVDVLPDPRIRQELSALSNWPTIPQLFVRGELVGGCDIITEMYQSGELAQVLGVEAPEPGPEPAPEPSPVPPEPSPVPPEPSPAPPEPEVAPRPLGIENRLPPIAS
jgi:monothiol glutaredoxin